MLALQPLRGASSNQYIPNILPCRIHHDGPAKVTKRFWSPTQEQDGTKTAYFRGRKLRGRTTKLPARYRGVAATTSDRTLAVQKQESMDEDDEEEDEEEEAEPVKILETAAFFNEVTVWSHDILPADDDPFVKGVEEWIAFAEAIHGRMDEEMADNSNTNSMSANAT